MRLKNVCWLILGIVMVILYISLGLELQTDEQLSYALYGTVGVVILVGITFLLIRNERETKHRASIKFSLYGSSAYDRVTWQEHLLYNFIWIILIGGVILGTIRNGRFMCQLVWSWL